MTPQVTLYNPHTSQESLGRRRRTGIHRQVLSDHVPGSIIGVGTLTGADSNIPVTIPSEKNKIRWSETHGVYSGKRLNTVSVRNEERV